MTVLPVIRRGLNLVVLAALAAAVLTATRPEPTIDLSTPDAILNAAFNGTLVGYMDTQPVIPGDSKARNHEGAIEIDSMGLSMSRPAPAQPLNMSITFTKRFDKATARLAARLFNGTSLTDVRIQFETPATDNTKPRIVLEIVLKTVNVSAHVLNVDGNGTEQLELKAGEIRIDYFVANSDSGPISACWKITGDDPCA